MFKALFSSAKSALAKVFWPRAKIVSALQSRYTALDDLGEEDGLRLYGVTDGEIRFVVALILLDGAADRVVEVGFLARFSGFTLSNAQLETVNRNLHISVATFHNDGDLYIIGGVAAAGEYSDGAFALILEAWKRDLLVVLHGITSASFVDAMPASRSETARRYALNEAARDPTKMLSAFAGAQRLSLCPACGGRGFTGLIARACDPCAGTGLASLQAVEPMGRRR
ncbi:MAG: hypothetical protein U5J99_05880 [Parvularculaceae bacterium]|nr:hypothetical protein [Parvularculaceae bacterium]